MDVVIDPDVLFVSDERWNNTDTRDEYLCNVLDLLDYIDSYPKMKICWNDDFELLLWEDPSRHPWQVDKDFRIPMVQMLQNKLAKNVLDVEDSILYDPCISDSIENLCPQLLQLMHYCIHEKKDIYLVTDRKDLNRAQFSCEHQESIEPYVVFNQSDFLNIHQIVSELWPNELDEANQFEFIVKLFLRDSSLYDYIFTKSFIKSIIPFANMGEMIIGQIVKRLTLNLGEAQSDASLHDEYIESSKERRMRVTGRPTSTRIHYEYSGKNTLVFKRFYGPGEHDKGL